MQVKTFYLNPFRECTYLISYKEGECIIIDCGCYGERECQRIREYVEKNNLRITHHLLTHAHIDHLFGAWFIYNEYGILPTLSEQDDWLFTHVQQQAAAFGIPLESNTLQEYIPLSTISIEGMTTISTPGHSPGSVCYLFHQPQSDFLFSGDTLFQGGIGRTDLFGGNYYQLMSSLNLLAKLPAETLVYPGHGFETTLGQEISTNPYLQGW